MRLGVLKIGGEALNSDEEALNGNRKALKSDGGALKCVGEAFNPYSAGITFSRQNLTDVRF